MNFTNVHNISLPIAVWLLHDEYDYVHKPNYISATSLLAPLKQFVLAKRIPFEERQMDASDLIAASFGTAVHDSIEKAWVKRGPELMEKLGFPKAICDRIVVNPTDDYLRDNPDALPVWIEQRGFKEIDGYTVGGKFDIVIDKRLFDIKSTSVWAYIFGSRDEDHSRQGSIYRWLFPEKIDDDFVYINYIFTDWSKKDALAKPDSYPQLKTIEKAVPLMSIEATEQWIRDRIALIKKYRDVPEEDMPECTDEELWRSKPQWKYYADASKTDGRSTKNFDNKAEAHAHCQKAGKGVVKEVLGEVKRCGYCAAAPICQQRLRYFDV